MILAGAQYERSFYHSFPRMRPSDTRDFIIEKGLAILEAINSIGLILAPEVVEWSIPQVDGTTKVIRHRQVRICFTELSELELTGHAKTFGPFSLQFDVNLLRQFGVLPVIYVPQMVKGDRVLSSFGPVVVWMFENIRGTLDLLDQLRTISDPVASVEFARRTNPEATVLDPNCVLHLTNTDPEGGIVRRFDVQANTVRGILDFLNYRTAPFALMRGAVWAAQNLFYPTDDKVNDKVLSYYRQREWRIIPGATVEGHTVARVATSAEKETLLRLDERFWSRELEDDKGRFKRIDEAHVISEFQGSHIASCIRKIIVPADAYQRARGSWVDRVETIDPNAE